MMAHQRRFVKLSGHIASDGAQDMDRVAAAVVGADDDDASHDLECLFNLIEKKMQEYKTTGVAFGFHKMGTSTFRSFGGKNG
eukprot:SAG31_NODE_5487_length_2511_cov_6.334577_3_plen_82_part_00